MSIAKGRIEARTFRVFISYSTEDMTIVRKLEAALKGAGATVFVAEHSVAPGESLRAGIEAALNNCDLFVVLWSKRSAASEWVRQEIGHATGRDKRIVPFVLDADAKIPVFLQDQKYIRAYENMDEGIEDIARHVTDLFVAKKKQIEDRNAQGWALLIAAVLAVAAMESKKG